MRSLLHIGSGNDHNPLTMSDEHILEEIYSTHVHSDTKFDAQSLFNVAGNILTRSTHVVDNVMQVCIYKILLINKISLNFFKENTKGTHTKTYKNNILAFDFCFYSCFFLC